MVVYLHKEHLFEMFGDSVIIWELDNFVCECGYKQNTVNATFCGGCGRKIEIIGVKESEWSSWEGH